VIYRGGEVEAGVGILSVVMMACSASSLSSLNGGYGRMEVPNSGGTPASNCRRTGDLQRGNCEGEDVLQQGEELIAKIRGRGSPFWRRPGVRSSSNGGSGEIGIRAFKLGFRGNFFSGKAAEVKGYL
jgi:hypothetical protein